MTGVPTTGVITWVEHHVPREYADLDIINLLESMEDAIYEKFLMRKCKLEPVTLRKLSLIDLASVNPDDRYVTLLAHIFTVGIQGITADHMCVFMDWMIRDLDFETALIVYIWSESCLNDPIKFPVHTDCIQVCLKGCSRYTLDFLWNTSKFGDQLTTLTALTLSRFSENDVYLKALTYTYISTGCDGKLLTKFFKDIHRMTDEDIIDFTEAFVTYAWTLGDIEELCNKGYTAKELYKPLIKHTEKSFMLTGRRFPVSSLPKHLFAVRDVNSFAMDLPEVPQEYHVNYYMWSDSYSPNPSAYKNVIKNKYELWFENLNREQLIRFQQMNPIVFDACRNRGFEYVQESLDSLMPRI